MNSQHLAQASGPESTIDTTIQYVPEPKTETSQLPMVVGAGITLAVVLVCVALFILRRRRNKTRLGANQQIENQPQQPEQPFRTNTQI